MAHFRIFGYLPSPLLSLVYTVSLFHPLSYGKPTQKDTQAQRSRPIGSP